VRTPRLFALEKKGEGGGEKEGGEKFDEGVSWRAARAYIHYYLGRKGGRRGKED